MEEMEINDVSAEEFSNFLKLIYPDEFEIKVTNYPGLMNLADRFSAPRVSEMIKQFLVKNFLSVDKIEVLKLAFQLDNKDLKDLVAIFIGSRQAEYGCEWYICPVCGMPLAHVPFCTHPSGGHYTQYNGWIHDNFDKIRELSPEIQYFILAASVRKT